MISPHSSGSAGQLARKQGMARMSAVTFCISAASVLGAVAIGITLPSAPGETTRKQVETATRTQGVSTTSAINVVWSQPHSHLSPGTGDAVHARLDDPR